MVKESTNLMLALVDFKFEQFATVHIARMVYRLIFGLIVIQTLLFLSTSEVRANFLRNLLLTQDVGFLNFAWLVFGIALNIAALAIVRLVLEYFVVAYVGAHKDPGESN